MTVPGGTAGAGGRAQSDWAIYRRLLGYVRPHWIIFLVAVLGFQLGSAAEAYFVNLFGRLIDSWPDAALSVPVLMLAAAVARAGGEVAGELLLNRISFTVVHRLRTELFDRLLVMPSEWFDAASGGRLVSRITYNVAQLRDTGTDALKSLVQDGGKLIVYLAVMLYLSWKLTLVFLAIAPLVGAVVALASRRLRSISRRIQDSMGEVTQRAAEAVNAYRVVRVFAGEAYEREQFARASASNRREHLKMVRTKVATTQLIQVFVALALAVLIALLLQPSLGGGLSVGDVVAFLGLGGLLARPIRKLSELNARLQRGLAAAEDVFAQLDQPGELDEGEHDVDRVTGRIEFSNVSFSYERGNQSVLQQVDLVIEPGSTVALVGRSGSGKTTLASLIPRFYEPDSGQILLDGVPLERYRLGCLRRQISLVSQDVRLFNDSLARNIAYGDRAEASAEAVADAVRRAHVDVFVDRLPDGLATRVGDDGVLLSGGQRQRVAIARALLKDAPILILDEATSALDATAERHIKAALAEVMRGRTTIVIAHRLSTVEGADVILVMDDGRIVERGTHGELLSAGGLYAELYQTQFEVQGESPDAEGERTFLPPGAYPESRPALESLEQRLHPLARAWYSGARWPKLLLPLSWLYGLAARRRRLGYLKGTRATWRAPVPLIIVGNITAGGTGKTPLVIWLAGRLRDAGFEPGIVLRGHGGRRRREPLRVTKDTSPDEAGDEAVLLARRTGCPVMAGRDRAAAVRSLLESTGCDLVISDDGLQHYALARDIEIAVIDGGRGAGNGLLQPAGPLREGVDRLAEVDWVVSGGSASTLWPEATVMRITPRRFVKLADPAVAMDAAAFAKCHGSVTAAAGIGNPERFFETLREVGLEVDPRALPDHYRYRAEDFAEEGIVVVTEKDAVKLERLSALAAEIWYLEVDARLEEVAGQSAEAKLSGLLRLHGVHG